MQIVCARFGNNVNDAPSRAPELRACSGRDDLKLFDGIKRNVYRCSLAARLFSEESIVVVASVKTDVVEDASLSGEVNLVAIGPLSNTHSRSQSEQVFEFPSEHRQVADR